jgi:hypothetical protein
MHAQRKLLLACLGLVCAMLLLPFFLNEHLRYAYRATVAHYIAKVSSPRVVLIGDSLAASARDWRLTLGAFRFSRGLLADRYTTDGVHLNGLAYASLDRALRAMEGGASDRGSADAIMRSNVALRTCMEMR